MRCDVGFEFKGDDFKYIVEEITDEDVQSWCSLIARAATLAYRKHVFSQPMLNGMIKGSPNEPQYFNWENHVRGSHHIKI